MAGISECIDEFTMITSKKNRNSDGFHLAIIYYFKQS